MLGWWMVVTMVKKQFSKAIGDISAEVDRRSEQRSSTLRLQEQAQLYIDENFSERTKCILCHASVVEDSYFLHRGVKYFRCERCSHVQTSRIVEDYFPWDVLDFEYAEIYPQIEESD